MHNESTPAPYGLIPRNRREATSRLKAIQSPLNRLPAHNKENFLRGWNALFYLNPGLHPDESENPQGGWPVDLLPVAREAWSRYETGDLSDEEFYCSDASWSGLFDQIDKPTEEERAYRQKLTAS